MTQDRRQRTENRRRKTEDSGQGKIRNPPAGRLTAKSEIRNLLSHGLTLLEMLAALTIGSMVLIIVLTIYSRAQTSAADVFSKLESNRLPQEILQRIAEDLDRLANTAQDVQITIDNKFEHGLPSAKMEIVRNINDAKNQPQVLEKIVWQSSTEPDTGLFALYRSHSGIALEDSLLDRQKEPWQRELFVPICTGLTFFRIEVPQDSNVLLDKWSNEQLPAAIIITLSFAEPYQLADGTFDVGEDDKVVRTIAIDRTRKPAFIIPPFDINDLNDVNLPAEANEPNQPAESSEPNDFNTPDEQDI
jgi:prepilin-type N-terminal cleavage/methylation domain-containing protein